MSADTAAPAPICYSINEAVLATGNALSRTRIYDLMRAGELETRKIGRRTMIMARSLAAYIEKAPPAFPQTGK